MAIDFCLKIAGSAGQGMQTIGNLLTKVYSRGGYKIFAHQDYHSRIRGGHNFFQITVSCEDVFSVSETLDLVIALNSKAVTEHKGELKEGGNIIYDASKCPDIEADDMLLDVPFNKLAISAGGKPIFASSVATGAALALVGFGDGLLAEMMKEKFSDPAILEANLKAVKAGYEYVLSNFPNKCDNSFTPSDKIPARMVINGNESIALGAIAAGCSFYSAYPMTPSTSVMVLLAHYQHQFDICVEQVEDEISAINMALGASYAGARAMTGTSGGGFALMVEGISLAGIIETPVVIALVQRPGPATGLPTRTEQSDLLFALNAGHGEFSRAIFTPGTAEEAFETTFHAFNLADKYQIPVIIMSDQHLADSYRNIEPFSTDSLKIERCLDDSTTPDYARFALTPSGVSPRRIPGKTEGLVVVDSDEHTEDGHITEDLDVRVKMAEKRVHKKMVGIKEEVIPPKLYGESEGDILLIGFGSTYGAIREAVDELNASGKKAAQLHYSQVWPLCEKGVEGLRERYKKIFTVENNSTAQLAWIMRAETGFTVDGKILKYDGRAFTVPYILNALKKA